MVTEIEFNALYRTLTEARGKTTVRSKMTLAFEQLKKDPNYVAAFDDLKGGINGHTKQPYRTI